MISRFPTDFPLDANIHHIAGKTRFRCKLLLAYFLLSASAGNGWLERIFSFSGDVLARKKFFRVVMKTKLFLRFNGHLCPDLGYAAATDAAEEDAELY